MGDRMVQEAEAAKESDEAAKKVIDLKNEADQAVYNTEKQLQEHSARIPQNIKDQINTDITGVNEALTTEDPEKIKEAIERLKNSSMEIGKAIYANQDGDAAPEGEPAQEEPKPEDDKKEEEPKKEKEEPKEEKK